MTVSADIVLRNWMELWNKKQSLFRLLRIDCARSVVYNDVYGVMLVLYDLMAEIKS